MQINVWIYQYEQKIVKQTSMEISSNIKMVVDKQSESPFTLGQGHQVSELYSLLGLLTRKWKKMLRYPRCI